MVYKTTGFGTDNLLAGFAGMGHTYVEIFINFNKRVFNWLFDLFDHKVVPNLPNDGPNPSIREKLFPTSNNTLPSNKYLWVDEAFNKPRNKDFDLNEWIKTPYNVNINPTPWYRDSTTWIWFGGTMLTAGVIYLGYKIFMDPLFIEDLPIIGNWFNKGTPTGVVDTAVVVTSPNGSITPTNATAPEFVQGSSTGGTKSLLTMIGGGFKKLNPATWFLSTVDVEAQERAFAEIQWTDKYDNRFYPFTEVNPYDHWLTRWRISWLGETTFERRARHAIKLDVLNHVAPPLKLKE